MLGREVIERTFDTVLQAGGANRPMFDVVDANFASGATTFVARGRKDPPPTHSILEIDYELFLIDTIVPNSPSGVKWTATPAIRGYQETDAAAHSAGALIYYAPRWTRISVLNALKGVIGNLYGWGLYRRQVTTSLYADTGTVQNLPAGAFDVVSVREEMYPAPNQIWSQPLRKGRDFEVYTDVEDGDPAQIQFNLGNENSPTRIVYKTDFGAVVDQDTDLTVDCGVPETLQPHLPLAIAGELLAGKEVPRMQTEAIRKVLEAAGGEMPIGSSIQVGRALLDTFRFVHVAAERERLVKKDGIRIVHKAV